MNKILMVAFHYPPDSSSSGVQRTLSFSRNLPDLGWKPIVLTAHPRAYPRRQRDQLADIPASSEVHRAFALDSARHLAIGGRYSRLSALPDRWIAWWAGAVAAGVRLIRRHRPEVIWSTYPIATAHLIGCTLQRLSRLPWVADFRDSMTEEGYPSDPQQRRVYQWVERRAMARCAQAVFTADGTRAMYARRYPETDASRLGVIANGFDEDVAGQVDDLPSASGERWNGRRVVLLHSGALYPMERDPTKFYQAVSELVQEKRIRPEDFRLTLRASGHDDHHRRLHAEYGIEKVVALEPAVAYRSALREMKDVDGLLVFQTSNCNHQIPAKIYEYIWARRPILALTDPEGDTAGALRGAGYDAIVPLDDKDAIKARLLRFVNDIRERRAVVPAELEVERYSRRARARELAMLCNRVAGGRG